MKNKDVTILNVKGETKNDTVNSLFVDDKQYFNPIESISKEAEDYNLDLEILQCDVSDIPSKIRSNLIIFLSENIYVKDDFLNVCISLNNLFRKGGVFCGPVNTKTNSLTKNDEIEKLSKSYYSYNLDFGSSEISNITGEEFNYGSLIGSVVTGAAYNEIGYSPIISNRHSTADNRLFISKIAKRYDIIYAKSLSKCVLLTNKDFSIESLSDYYYQLGYQDGLFLLEKTLKDKHKELWHRFVESPEVFDNEMPRWLFDSSPDKDGGYLESLVLMKCKYQIGFYEGMLGKKLI